MAGLVLTLTGCVEVVQYISGSADSLDVYLRVALQKSAFELANSFADDPQDMDQVFENEFDLQEDDVIGDLPDFIQANYTPVNSEFEYGFELRYKLRRNQLDALIDSGMLPDNDADAAFVPRVTDEGISIPLAEGGGTDAAAGGDQMAAAFLGGSKYRLMISRRLAGTVSAARLVTPEETTQLDVTELPDVWMIEFPVLLWLSAPAGARLEIEY